MSVVAETTGGHTAPSAPCSFARHPAESWWLGSLPAFSRDGLAFYRQCEALAGIVEARFLYKRVYVVTDPDAIADVLCNHPRAFIKPFILRRMKVLFGNGLLTSEGDEWHRNRHLVQPAFHSERMAGFFDAVRANTEALAQRWRDAETRDIYPDVVDLCLKNLAQTMFGVFDAELEGHVRELVKACQALMHSLSRTLDLSLLYPSPLKRHLEQSLQNLDAYLSRLIDRRSREAPRDDFFGLLLSGGGAPHPALSRQAVLDESVTMLLAGHETVSSALIWSVYLLARHPEWADALAADLETELHGDAPSMAQLHGLQSLQATLDEAMRLYPPTHRIGRTVVAPVVVGGHSLEVGAEVVIPQWAVHRSPRWYDDPEAFRPSRWTHAFRQGLPKFAFLPFSGGPRACVGSHFVWFESLVILAVLAQHFRFATIDDAPLVPYEGLTLTPAGGQLRVRLSRRR